MNQYLQSLKNLILTELKGERVKVVLFGSRARGDYHLTSDIDIGILPFNGLNQKKITLLKEKIEDLNIPYKVEVVNLLEASESFKKESLNNATVWKEC